MTTTPERKTPEHDALVAATWAARGRYLYDDGEDERQAFVAGALFEQGRAAGLLADDPTEEQVERAARAVWERYAGHGPWETLSPERQAPFRKDARAALAAAGAAQELIAEAEIVDRLRLRIANSHVNDEWVCVKISDLDHVLTALAAAPVVDEAKLVQAIADELETDSRIAEEWSAGKLDATARRLVKFAVLPTLRGGGQ